MPSRTAAPRSLFPLAVVHRDPLTGLQLVPPAIVYADRFYAVFSSLLDRTSAVAKGAAAEATVKQTVPDVVYLSEVTIPSSLLFHYERAQGEASSRTSSRGTNATAASLLPSFYMLVSTTHLYIGQYPSNRVILEYSIFNDIASICLCQQSGCMVLRHRQAVAPPHSQPGGGESAYSPSYYDCVFALKNTKETEFFLNIVKTVKLTLSDCLGAAAGDPKRTTDARGDEGGARQATRYTPATADDLVQRWPVGSYEALPHHARPVRLGSPFSRLHSAQSPPASLAPLTFLGETEVECKSRRADCLYRSHEEEEDLRHEELFAEENVLRAVLTEPHLLPCDELHPERDEDATAHDLLVSDKSQLSDGAKEIVYFLQHKWSRKEVADKVPAVAAAAAIEPHGGERHGEGDSSEYPAGRRSPVILGQTRNRGAKINVVLARRAGARPKEDDLLRLTVEPVGVDGDAADRVRQTAPPAVDSPAHTAHTPTLEKSGWSAVTPLESSLERKDEEERQAEEEENEVAEKARKQTDKDERSVPAYDSASLSSPNSPHTGRAQALRARNEATNLKASASNTSRYFEDYRLCYDEHGRHFRAAPSPPPPPPSHRKEDDSTFDDVRSLLLQMRRKNDFYQGMTREKLPASAGDGVDTNRQQHARRHPKMNDEAVPSRGASRKKQVSDFFESLNRTFDTVH